LLIIEIVLTVLFVYYLLSFEYNISYDIRGFREEDLMASLISINYLNISDINVLENLSCSVVAEVLDEYVVFLNNVMVCNNTDRMLNNSIKVFYIINGTPVYVTIYMK